eukprot:m51a1_g10661 hypothetical protein (244) ;mRNA; r:258-1155
MWNRRSKKAAAAQAAAPAAAPQQDADAVAVEPPPVDAADTQCDLRISVSDDLALVSIRPPQGTARAPLDVVCVVDVSGSMQTDAPAPASDDAGKREHFGFSVLDLVKHAVATVAHVLGPADRLAIVAFSGEASVVLQPTAMSEAGRGRADKALDEMYPSGSTNLWAGLEAGIKLLETSGSPQRVGAVMLLTDGQPDTVQEHWVRKRCESHGQVPGTVSAFGFGYSLNSQLLAEIAAEGLGAYA